ncbi:MAG: HAMP domain-containing histidine kinase [Verrucomicrobiae bacterium]|nr:HAMP domain-containing histidine kinase [Verrucomicrobiae bacterium]
MSEEVSAPQDDKHGSNGAAHGIPWHRRLSLRLALLFGSAILLFNVMREPLFNAAWNLVYSDDRATSGESTLIDPLSLPRRFEAFLIDSPPGTIDAESKEAVDFASTLRDQYYSFAWVAQDGSLAAIPEDLDLRIGTQWAFDNGVIIPVVRSNETVTAGLAYMENFPLEGGRGMLVLISIDPRGDFGDTVEPGTLVLPLVADSPLLIPDTRDPQEERRRFERLQQLVSVGVAVLLAALLGLMVAWFITRRLAHMARGARLSLEEQTVPSRFEIGGHDEITSLAESINQSRDRMAALLKEVQHRDRTRREWIAQVSHDIRTPLTALAACIDRAEGRTIGVQDPAVRTELSLMLHTAKADLDRLNTLTKDLLESARLDLDESLNMEELLPAELARHTMATIRPYAQSKRINISTEIPRGLPMLNGDGSRLMRAFENLVKNAIQHAKERVTISLEADATEFRFIVDDDGDGLPEKDGQVILAAKGKNPNKQDSSGLGLIVTRKIVDAHKGQLKGENRACGGARMMICLPVAPEDAE